MRFGPGHWLRKGPRRTKRDDRIVELYSTGITASEVGKQMGMSTARVLDILRDRGIELRKPKGSYPHHLVKLAKKNEDRKRTAQIVRMRAAGADYTEIGRRFGVSRQRIQQIVARQASRRVSEDGGPRG